MDGSVHKFLWDIEWNPTIPSNLYLQLQIMEVLLILIIKKKIILTEP